MNAPKRVVSEVGLDGATVFYVTRERAAFLTRGGLLLWVDFSDRKDLSAIPIREGECTWIYFAKHNNSVVSFMRDAGEKVEDLPRIDTVEV